MGLGKRMALVVGVPVGLYAGIVSACLRPPWTAPRGPCIGGLHWRPGAAAPSPLLLSNRSAPAVSSSSVGDALRWAGMHTEVEMGQHRVSTPAAAAAASGATAPASFAEAARPQSILLLHTLLQVGAEVFSAERQVRKIEEEVNRESWQAQQAQQAAKRGEAAIAGIQATLQLHQQVGGMAGTALLCSFYNWCHAGEEDSGLLLCAQAGVVPWDGGNAAMPGP